MSKSAQKYTPRPGTKREVIVGMLEKGEPVEKIHKALDRYAKKQGRVVVPGGRRRQAPGRRRPGG
jgi:hypothetical protein